MSALCPSSARTPFDQDDGVTLLQEQVLELLEAAGIPASVNDRVVELIAQGEIAAGLGA